MIGITMSSETIQRKPQNLRRRVAVLVIFSVAFPQHLLRMICVRPIWRSPRHFEFSHRWTSWWSKGQPKFLKMEGNDRSSTNTRDSMIYYSLIPTGEINVCQIYITLKSCLMTTVNFLGLDSLPLTPTYFRHGSNTILKYSGAGR